MGDEKFDTIHPDDLSGAQEDMFPEDAVDPDAVFVPPDDFELKREPWETDADFQKKKRKALEYQKKIATQKETLDEVLNILQPGYRVMIHRTQPNWCARWLETIEIDEEDLSDLERVCGMEYLRDTWGGEKFRLQFKDPLNRFITSKVVPMRGVPPKDNGAPLESPAEKAARLEREKIETQRGINNNDAMTQMMGLIMQQTQSGAKDQIAIMREMMNLQNQNTANAAPQSPFEQFREMVGMFAMMREMMPQGGGEAQQPDELFGMAKDIMGMVMKGGGAGQAPSTPPQKMPRTKMPAMAAPAPEESQKSDLSGIPKKTLGEVIEIKDNSDDSVTFDEGNLKRQILAMDNEQIAHFLSETMGEIGEERAGAIFQEFGRISSEEVE